MISSRTAPLRGLATALLSLALGACGGGGDGGSGTVVLSASALPDPSTGSAPPPAADIPPSTQTPGSTEPAAPPASAPERFVISGALTGLAANTKLVLLDNGGDALTLAANGAFSFASPVAFNMAYAVTIATQPLWQACTVANGNGTAVGQVTNVDVSCATAQAQVSTWAGSATPGSADGNGASASFSGPEALAIDGSGNLYVMDTDNEVVRKVTPAGDVTTLAASAAPGYSDGVAVDANGNVYIADYDNNAIRKITPSGDVSILAGSTNGSADGTGIAAQFNGPAGLDVDANGNVYVADYGNNMIRKITPDGVVTTLAGSTTRGSADGQGAAASFNKPNGVKVDASGNAYVADASNHLIRKITPDGVVTTLAGSTPGYADGTGAAAQFSYPWGIALDASGYVYVADSGTDTIRRIAPNGVVTTLAGSGTRGSDDGLGAVAQFDDPFDVAVDASGNVYVLQGNVIRKITPLR
ncbi:NHL repeat-containing protein [Variovorax soli]|uniref:Sugar lactone lactonase YvrE n=1 Tax=Variovorax soli TaxID=376815 RepID=A0ABU1N795_9BURK|nr:NHL repeat-containing protein [Variovorax soli]MDR6534325.1 sugar lactone lactonase YvrE [Variovorax soli]